MKKKLIPFVIAIALVLIFAQLYTFKLYGNMQESGYLINDNKVMKALLAGTAEEGERSELLEIKSGEPVYSRGSARYLGELKVRINNLAPMLINDGAALMALDANGALIDTELSYLPTYEGLYVSAGHSFNSDGSQADEEEFILYGLANGAAINVQGLDVILSSGEKHIPMNSIVDFEADEVRFYAFDDGELVYRVYSGLLGARIRIGSNEYDYADFLKRLGIITEELMQSISTHAPEIYTTTAVPSATPEPKTPQPSMSDEPHTDETGVYGTPGPVGTAMAQNTQKPDSSTPTPTPEASSSPTAPTSAPGEQQNPGSAGASGGASASQPSTGGGQASGSEGGAGTGSGTGGEGTGSSGAPVEPAFRLPVIKAENIKATVYTVSCDVTIEDPDQRLTKGARLLIYNNGKLIMRKTVKGSGTVSLGTLPPGSSLEIEGTFEYLDASNIKRTTVFLTKTQFETLDRSFLNDIAVTLDKDNQTLLPMQVVLRGLSMSEILPAEGEEQAPDSVMNYISRVTVTVTPKNGGAAMSLDMDTASLNKLRNGSTIDWTSPAVFDSNTQYDYTLEIFDRFGDQALSTQPQSITGETRTCRRTAQARIKLVANNVNSTVLSVSVTDADGSYKNDGQSGLRLVIYDENGALARNLTVASTTGDETVYADGAIPLEVADGQSFNITNLAANKQYSAVVMCPCDIEDGSGVKEYEIGRTNFYTASISTLGYAYFKADISDITSSSADIAVTLMQRTNVKLRALMDTLTYTVSSPAGIKCSVAFEKNARDEQSAQAMFGFYDLGTTPTGVGAGEDFSITLIEGAENQPAVRVFGTAASDTDTVWDALVGCSASVEIKLAKGMLDSAQLNSLTVPVTVDQGGVRQSVISPYTVATFRTMRMTPKVQSEASLAAESFFEIYDLNIDDPDGAIKGGKLYAKLIKTSSDKVIDIQTIETNHVYDTLRFTGLENNVEYRLEFICIEYNEGFQQATLQTQYVLPDKFVFTTGLSIKGKLNLESLEYSNPDEATQLFGANLYVADNTKRGVYISTNGAELSASNYSAYALGDYIPVDEGALYAIKNLCPFGDSVYNIVYYNQNKVRTGAQQVLGFNAAVQIPSGVSYVRFNMNIGYINYASMQKIYAQPDTQRDILSGVEWTNGIYLNRNNGTTTTSTSYKCTDYLPVEAGATYIRMSSASNNPVSTVCFYKADKTFISSIVSGTNGGIIQVPDNAAFMRTYCYTNCSTMSMYPLLPGSGSNAMTATLRAIVDDPQSTLAYDGSKYVLRLTDADGNTKDFTYDTPITEQGETDNIDALCPILVAADKKYTVQLVVLLQGKYEVVLDKVSFETQSRISVIHNEAELYAITANPYGSYVVVNDIRCVNSTAIVGSFYGTLDFNGHTLTRTVNSSAMFGYVMQNASVKNIVLEYTFGNVDRSYSSGSISTYNNGTIENIIIRLSGSSNGTALSSFGGIVYNNNATGVIQNFVINFVTPIYFQNYFGGVAPFNSGVIRCGYVYGEDLYACSGSLTGNSTSERSSNGDVIGRNNITGSMSDVFCLNNIHIEDGTRSNYSSILLGYTTGEQRNMFTVGDRYTYTISAENGYVPIETTDLSIGPAIGLNTALERTSNVMYVSDNIYMPKYNSKVSKQVLWDVYWYEQLFERDESFLVDSTVMMGYYPQIALPETMMDEQELIALPSVIKPQAPQLLTALVTNQTNEYADVILTFANPQSHTVSAVFAEGASVEVYQGEENQYFDGDLYRVKARVYSPTLYRDGYKVLTTTSQWEGMSVIAEYGTTASSYELVTIPASFYKLIYTSDDWTSMQSDQEGNYRLAANIDLSDRVPNKLQLSNFKGKLDGGIYDENGILTGMYTIFGLNTGMTGYVINQTNEAVIQNIIINDAKLGNANKNNVCGFIGTATNSVIDNVHISNMVCNPSGYGGTIAASANSCIITNCSATDCTIVTQKVSTLYIGGLVGYMYGSGSMNNCFVQGMSITAKEGLNCAGIGGIVGYVAYGTGLKSCVAQGEIQTAFAYTGGIAGYFDGTYGNYLSYVSITSTTGSFGGICGYSFGSTINHSLVIGDLYAINSMEGVNRVYGAVRSATTGTGTYAYASQLLGGTISDDRTYVSGLLTSDELRQESTYTTLIGFESDFDTSCLKDGYLPCLLSTNGEAFDNQRPMLIPDDTIRLAEVLGTKNTDAGSGYKDEATYTVSFELYHSGYTVKKISVDGMQFVGLDGDPSDYSQSKDGFTVTAVRDGVSIYTISRYYPTEKRGNYRLRVTLVSTDGQARVMELSAKVELDAAPYHIIENAADWQRLMGLYGSTYEDFVITGDVDFSTIAEPVVINVKVGSVIGRKNGVTGESVKIRGLDYKTLNAGDALFAEVAGEIERIDFENISWNSAVNKKGGSNVGLIGMLSGSMNYVNFNNIDINSYSAVNAGLIGTFSGRISNVTLTDIRHVSTAGASSKGLLVGNATAGSTIEYVTVAGTDSGTTDENGKPVANTYLNVLGSNVGIIAGTSLASVSNITIGSDDADAPRIIVSGSSTVGGLIGYSANSIYQKYANIYNVDVKATGNYAAGATAFYGVQNYCLVKYSTVSAAGLGAGGIAGCLGTGNNNYVYDCTISAGAYGAGGIYGNRSFMASNCAVYNCKISAGTYGAGGIIGDCGDYTTTTYSSHESYNNTITAGTYGAGGIVGRGCGASIGTSVGNTVTAGTDGAGGIVGYCTSVSVMNNNAVVDCNITSTVNAGGVVGYSLAGTIDRCYVRDTSITALTDCAGGLAGYQEGGTHQNSFVYANVEAMGRYAGGLFGKLQSVGYAQSAGIAKIVNCVSYTGVTAADYAGGLAGCITRAFNTDPAAFSDNTVSGTLLITTVICTGPTDAVSGGNEYTGEHAGLMCGRDALDAVQSSGLAGVLSYVNSSANGRIADTADVATADSALLGTQSTYEKTLGWNLSKSWSATALVADGTGSEAAPYGILPFVRNNYATNSVYAVLNGQKGCSFDASVVIDSLGTTRTRLSFGTDDANGVPVPIFEAPALMSMFGLRQEGEIPKFTVYASGADTVNIEFDASVPCDPINEEDAWATFEINNANGDILASHVIDRRVYTLSYDFTSELTLTLSSATGQQTYSILPADVRSTVMTWGDDYYYINAGGIAGSNGVLSGDFVNVFKGFALTSDGALYNLGDGECVRESTQTGLTTLRPLFTTAIGEDVTLYTFNGFTIVKNAEGETVNELRLMAKAGEIRAMDPTASAQTASFVIDEADGREYAIMLLDSGEIYDIASNGDIAPSGMRNFGIVQTSCSIGSDSTVMLMRYDDGSAAAFDYVSGEIISLDAPATAPSMLTYVSGYFAAAFAAEPTQLAEGYQRVSQLAEQLSVTPFEGSVEGAYANGMSELEGEDTGAAENPPDMEASEGDGAMGQTDGSGVTAGTAEGTEGNASSEYTDGENAQSNPNAADGNPEAAGGGNGEGTSTGTQGETTTDGSGAPGTDADGAKGGSDKETLPSEEIAMGEVNDEALREEADSVNRYVVYYDSEKNDYAVLMTDLLMPETDALISEAMREQAFKQGFDENGVYSNGDAASDGEGEGEGAQDKTGIVNNGAKPVSIAQVISAGGSGITALICVAVAVVALIALLVLGRQKNDRKNKTK